MIQYNYRFYEICKAFINTGNEYEAYRQLTDLEMLIRSKAQGKQFKSLWWRWHEGDTLVNEPLSVMRNKEYFKEMAEYCIAKASVELNFS